MSRNIKCEGHNCRQCYYEKLGRCFHSQHYGDDVSITEEICNEFIDARYPERIDFSTLTVGMIKNYIYAYFTERDFVTNHTRKQLRCILEKLYPYAVKENSAGLAFTSMCKKRMVDHIEFYMKLHEKNPIRMLKM